MKRYPVSFTIDFHNPGLTKRQIEIKDGNTSAADSIVIIQIVEDKEKQSQIVISADGKQKAPIHPDALWHIWATWAKQMADNEVLTSAKRKLCLAVYEASKGSLLNVK